MILYPALLSPFPDDRSCLIFLTIYVLVVIGRSSLIQSLTKYDLNITVPPWTAWIGTTIKNYDDSDDVAPQSQHSASGSAWASSNSRSFL